MPVEPLQNCRRPEQQLSHNTNVARQPQVLKTTHTNVFHGSPAAQRWLCEGLDSNTFRRGGYRHAIAVWSWLHGVCKQSCWTERFPHQDLSSLPPLTSSLLQQTLELSLISDLRANTRDCLLVAHLLKMSLRIRALHQQGFLLYTIELLTPRPRTNRALLPPRYVHIGNINERHQAKVIRTEELQAVNRNLRISDDVRLSPCRTTEQDTIVAQAQATVRVIGVEPVALLTPCAPNIPRILQILHVTHGNHFVVLRIKVAKDDDSITHCRHQLHTRGQVIFPALRNARREMHPDNDERNSCTAFAHRRSLKPSSHTRSPRPKVQSFSRNTPAHVQMHVPTTMRLSGCRGHEGKTVRELSVGRCALTLLEAQDFNIAPTLHVTPAQHLRDDRRAVVSKRPPTRSLRWLLPASNVPGRTTQHSTQLLRLLRCSRAADEACRSHSTSSFAKIGGPAHSQRRNDRQHTSDMPSRSHFI
jgi:hypothetical protein